MIDFSALEDRVIANLSKDKTKISEFLENLDGHMLKSCVYFKDEIEAIVPRKPEETQNKYVKRCFTEMEKGNKELKTIRQKSKPCSFALAYGCFPEKLASTAKIPLDVAEKIFARFHNDLYPGISRYRNKVEQRVKDTGRIHLGLGCYLNSSAPSKEIRTLFNACSQFWSILSLIAVNEMHHRIDEANLTNDISINCAIYDSIYFHLTDNLELIKWLNDAIVPILHQDFLEDQPVKNEAVGEIGYNWVDTVKLPHDSTLDEISAIREKAREAFDATTSGEAT